MKNTKDVRLIGDFHQTKLYIIACNLSTDLSHSGYFDLSYTGVINNIN